MTVDWRVRNQTFRGSGGPAPLVSPRRAPVRRIRSDAEAIDVANVLATDFAREAARQGGVHVLPPVVVVDRLSQSGLLAITVPGAYGGLEASCVTLAEVIAIFAAANATLSEILQSHFYVLEGLRRASSDEQKCRYFQRILDGDLIGIASTEGCSQPLGSLSG